MSTPTKESAPVLDELGLEQEFASDPKPRWLGVPAVDGARVGDLELFVFGGDGEDLATVALVNDAEPHPVVFECPISEVNTRTLEWIRSIAALDADQRSLIEAGERLRKVEAWLRCHSYRGFEAYFHETPGASGEATGQGNFEVRIEGPVGSGGPVKSGDLVTAIGVALDRCDAAAARVAAATGKAGR